MMEGIHRTHKASTLASADVISCMPDNVIANIMNRLPMRDAVRTGILARNWRLKWTLLTQLIFDYEMSGFLVTIGPEGKIYYDNRIISRLLLALKGPVTKFVLYIYSDQILDVGDLNNWVLFLSGKGIKELTLISRQSTPLRLPMHLFSCMDLTHLELTNCVFHPPPTFCGFPNLVSLVLHGARFESCKGGEFITQCPLLETMNLFADYKHYPLSRINLDDIAKLENLKKLNLYLCEVENGAITTSSILQSLGFLPKLEELCLNFNRCQFVAEDGAGKWVPTMFPCLSTLALFGVDFGHGSMLSCVFGMIWGSPKLQKLRIFVKELSGSTGDEYVPPATVFSSGLESNMVGQLQLQNVQINRFTGSKNEVCLMKYLLACSPFLKRAAVYSFTPLESDEKLYAAMKLLKLQRASTVAEIDFYEYGF